MMPHRTEHSPGIRGAHATKSSGARKVAPKAKAHPRASVKTFDEIRPEKPIRPGSKLEKIAKLLTRKEGCTAVDILHATGWPAVSVRQQARALRIKLRTEKQGRVFRYWAA